MRLHHKTKHFYCLGNDIKFKNKNIWKFFVTFWVHWLQQVNPLSLINKSSYLVFISFISIIFLLIFFGSFFFLPFFQGTHLCIMHTSSYAPRIASLQISWMYTYQRHYIRTGRCKLFHRRHRKEATIQRKTQVPIFLTNRIMNRDLKFWSLIKTVLRCSRFVGWKGELYAKLTLSHKRFHLQEVVSYCNNLSLKLANNRVYIAWSFHQD